MMLPQFNLVENNPETGLIGSSPLTMRSNIARCGYSAHCLPYRESSDLGSITSSKK